MAKLPKDGELMAKQGDSVGEVLSRFDARTDPFDEHEISDAVRRLRGKDDTSEPPLEWLAEAMAFSFCEDYRGRDGGWGTHFGPEFSGVTKDGDRHDWPSLNAVTPEMLDYWAVRAKEARHPILRARYAGLVWDLAKEATGGSPGVEMARIRIDSVIEIAASGAHPHETEIIRKLGHAI